MPSTTLDEFTEDTDTLVAPAQPERLAADILRALRHGTDLDFERCAALAPAVTTPLLETTLTWCAQSCEPTVARRAQYVLDVIEFEARGQRPCNDR